MVSSTVHPPQDPFTGCPQSTSRETLADPLHPKPESPSIGFRIDVTTGTVLKALIAQSVPFLETQQTFFRNHRD